MVLLVTTMTLLCSEELKKDKYGIKIRVENAAVSTNGDVVACVNFQRSFARHAMVFVLENQGDAAVRMCHCDVLKSNGFSRMKRSQIENKGYIAPG